jgi:hypothetical protein
MKARVYASRQGGAVVVPVSEHGMDTWIRGHALTSRTGTDVQRSFGNRQILAYVPAVQVAGNWLCNDLYVSLLWHGLTELCLTR